MNPSVVEESTRPATPGDLGGIGHLRPEPDSARFDSDWDAVERLTPIVFGDAGIRDRLLAAGDRREFCDAVAAVAADHGLDLPSERVEAMLSNARRRWVERWV
jgi:hypothetical protein